MNVIPAIDLIDGAVVRLRQGDFARRRSFDHAPVALAGRYATAGADRLHAVDLDGAASGTPAQLTVLAALAATGLKVQWGGGVRSRDDVEQLLAAGADRVVVGSLAVAEPARFADWLGDFGAERLVLALDLRQHATGCWHPAVDAWRRDTDQDTGSLLDRWSEAGLRHVLSTDIARDGMGAGPSLALYRWLATRWPQLQWIASGGVRDAADLGALAATGVAACVAGSALLDGTLPLSALAAAA